jgi:hypothetical protein
MGQQAVRDHVNVQDTGETTVEVTMPNEILRYVDELAELGQISRTEALVQAVATTRELVNAPKGARIAPIKRQRH